MSLPSIEETITANAATAEALAAALSAHPALPDHSLKRNTAPPAPADEFGTNALDDREYADLDDRPGTEDLSSINLQGETIRLFRQTKKLLSRVLSDTKTPVNQQAQVANTLGTLLRTLASQQTDLYNGERLKRLESAIIELVRSLPEEHAHQFMTAYENIVNV